MRQDQTPATRPRGRVAVGTGLTVTRPWETNPDPDPEREWGRTQQRTASGRSRTRPRERLLSAAVTRTETCGGQRCGIRVGRIAAIAAGVTPPPSRRLSAGVRNDGQFGPERAHPRAA